MSKLVSVDEVAVNFILHNSLREL